MRVLGWIVAIGLTAYGGVLTVAGLLVETGVIDAADDADERAIAGHAYFWDPWFACGASPSRWPCGAVATSEGCGMLMRHRPPLHDVRNLCGDADLPDARCPSACRA